MTHLATIEQCQDKAFQQINDDFVAALSNTELDNLFADSLSYTAHGLSVMAICFQEKLRRGLPTPNIRTGLLIHIPAIAQKKLAPEAVVAFAGMPSILHRLKGMALSEQIKLAEGKAIEIAEWNDKGEVKFEKKPLSVLSTKQIMRALEFGTIRSNQAQVRTIKNEVKSVRRPIKNSTKPRITVDEETGTVMINSMRVSVLDLEKALKILGYRLTKLDAHSSSKISSHV